MLGKRRERGNGKIKPYLVHVQLLNPGVFLEKGIVPKASLRKNLSDVFVS